jgi:hypothetical protein
VPSPQIHSWRGKQVQLRYLMLSSVRTSIPASAPWFHRASHHEPLSEVPIEDWPKSGVSTAESVEPLFIGSDPDEANTGFIQ